LSIARWKDSKEFQKSVIHSADAEFYKILKILAKFFYLICDGKSKMEERPLLSIDLGLYCTKVFVAKDSKSVINRVKGQVSDYIPTQIGFEDGKRVFGSFAERLAKTKPENVITNILYFVGRFYDENLQKYTKVRIEKLENQRFAFQIKTVKGVYHHYTVEECL
jgi:molecular chaperone DnaK (HSP70)